MKVVRHLQLYWLAYLAILKKSTYRAFGALFGRVGRATLPDVIVQLFKAKCLPALYYGSEDCPVNKTVTRSLQYLIKSCFSKIFQTKSDDVIAKCMNMFKCLLAAEMQFLDVKEIFCHSSVNVITFYVNSAVLRHQLSSDYGHYITF